VSETKTSKEVYDALIAAGVQDGDLVWMNTGVIYFIAQITPHVIQAIAPSRSVCHFEAYRDCYEGDTWPTHFATPYCFHGIWFEIACRPTTVIEYPEPEPLTLEQRIERLEKLQGVGK